MKSLRWFGLLVVSICCVGTHAQGNLIPVALDPVQNAPFTLTVETHWESEYGEPLKEGTRLLIRDSAGRQRYEMPLVDGVPTSSVVYVYDVVAGKRIKLDLKAKTAEVSPMRVGRTVAIDVSTAKSLPPATARDGQTLLGIKEIAGFEAWGQRTLKTTALQNGSSTTQDRELWTSTHYMMPVMQILRSEHGTTTQTVTHFSSTEPDPALFEIPQGFKVSDAPPETQTAPAPGTVRIGGDVSAPIALKTPWPEFSEQARRAKVSGSVLVHMIVDENGLPQNVTVTRGLGYGLDEKAVEAVRQYRFKPAMQKDMPVKVEMNVEVNFMIPGRP